MLYPFVAEYQMGYRSSHTNCIVHIIPLRGLSTQQEALCLFLREEAGRCWTDMLNIHIESRSGKWLSSNDIKKMFKGQYALHSQTIQALVEKLEANIDTARELRKTDPDAHRSVLSRAEAQSIYAWEEAQGFSGFRPYRMIK